MFSHHPIYIVCLFSLSYTTKMYFPIGLAGADNLEVGLARVRGFDFSFNLGLHGTHASC